MVCNCSREWMEVCEINPKISFQQKKKYSHCKYPVRHKKICISLKILKENGKRYNKIMQEKNEIVLVWPFAFHSGHNEGFNIGEVCNMVFWIS